jgi:hypothetical protein
MDSRLHPYMNMQVMDDMAINFTMNKFYATVYKKLQ